MEISLEIYTHTETGELDLEALQALAQQAIPLVWPHPGSEPSSLVDLPLVEVSLVDDASIGAAHAEFLNDPTPTDVITFHHGELLVSLETATRQASIQGLTTFQETLLYIIHGLLHLHGHEDATAAGAAGMAKLQQEILTTLSS